MRTEDRRSRVKQLGSDLQRSTHKEADAIKELLGLQLEEAKDNLIAARGDDIARSQGEALAITKLLTLITRPAPQMQRKMQEQ